MSLLPKTLAKCVRRCFDMKKGFFLVALKLLLNINVLGRISFNAVRPLNVFGQKLMENTIKALPSPAKLLNNSLKANLHFPCPCSTRTVAPGAKICTIVRARAE